MNSCSFTVMFQYVVDFLVCCLSYCRSVIGCFLLFYSRLSFLSFPVFRMSPFLLSASSPHLLPLGLFFSRSVLASSSLLPYLLLFPSLLSLVSLSLCIPFSSIITSLSSITVTPFALTFERQRWVGPIKWEEWWWWECITYSLAQHSPPLVRLHNGSIRDASLQHQLKWLLLFSHLAPHLAWTIILHSYWTSLLKKAEFQSCIPTSCSLSAGFSLLTGITVNKIQQ